MIALPVKDYAAAKRQFVEIYGSPIVMNTYLKIALLCLSFVCVALVALDIKSRFVPQIAARAANGQRIVVKQTVKKGGVTTKGFVKVRVKLG